MDFKSFGFSDPGKIRNHNEDSFLCNENEGFFLVADGMGGRPFGGKAGRLAVKSIEKFVLDSRKGELKWPIKRRQDLSLEQNRLLAATFFGNQKIVEMAKKNPLMKGMGTTLIGVVIENDSLAIVNVGDSRLYRIRGGEIVQLTKDQTFVGEQERNGLLTREAAIRHPNRHILTGALGHLKSVEQIDVSNARIEPEDLYLICSDGLYNMIDENRILDIIQSIQDRSLYKIGLSLVLEANLAGGLDNITVLLLAFK